MRIIVFLFICMSLGMAQHQISWSGRLYTEADTTFAYIEFTMDEGYHIYGVQKVKGPIATQIMLNNNADFTWLQLPKAKRHMDEGFGVEVDWYSGRDAFIIKAAGEIPLDGIQVMYQMCTESFCYPPTKITVPMIQSRFPLPGSEALANVRAQLKPTVVASDNDEYKAVTDQDLGSFILLAFSMGFIALMTPCVFPMIPITISFFTKNGEETRGKAVKLGFVYGAGIVLIFTLFGFVIAQLFGAAGVQTIAAHPVINLLIALMFVVFALNLFGMYEIQLPTGLVNRVNKLGLKPGYAGVLFGGVAFALVSFTCTAPFFGSLIVGAAMGEWFYPLVGMAAFSTAFASPFVLLAIFPQWMAQLPKSGAWLHSTKIVLGFVEIAAAFKFFSNVDLVWDLEMLTRPMMLTIWAVIALLSGLYLLKVFKIAEEDDDAHVSIGRLFTASVFLIIAVYMGTGINGRSLQSDLDSYLPPVEYGRILYHPGGRSGKTEGHSEENWIESFAEGLQSAKSSGQLMFVDFTGKTCTNCRWMEKNVFTRPEIKKHFDNMVMVRLWTDFGPDQELNQQLQMDKFKTVALPFYAIFDSDGNVIRTFPGMTRNPSEFERFLNVTRVASP